MARLIRFLLKLAAEGFYGEVRIVFKAGKVGQVHVDAAFLEETLPEPDTADPAYQKVLGDACRGVEWPT